MSPSQGAVSGNPANPASVGSSITNRAEEIAGILLGTGTETITTRQAHQLVDEFIASRGFDEIVRKLLSSQAVADRLFAVYALLQRDGFTDTARSLALADPSWHVRAEIAGWLFKRMDSAALESLVQEIVSSLSQESIHSIVTVADAAPKIEVPMGLSRLGLGESIPRYLNILSGHSSNTLAAVSGALGNETTSRTGKKLMLSVLASVRPPDYELLLKQHLQTEPALITRSLLAQHLAALISETNTQARMEIDSLLGDTGTTNARVSLQFHEAQLAELRQIEVKIVEACHQPNPYAAYLASIAAAYNEQLRKLGYEFADANTIGTIREYSAKHFTEISTDSLAEVVYVYDRTQAR